MRRILIILAHPAFERSRVQSYLIDAASGLEGVYIQDLYQQYPDFMIDVMREQALLIEHDIIILQHPFYWYSAPALLKEWQDLVLEHGFGYGTYGNSLRDKVLMNVVSAGASQASYQSKERNQFTVRQLLAPYEQMADTCNMRYLEPFVIYDAKRLNEKQIAQSAQRYKALLHALQQGEAWS